MGSFDPFFFGEVMAKVVKEAKNIEVLVNIKYEMEGDFLKQKFEFMPSNKKHLDYLFDARFLFKKKIDDLIKKNMLADFVKRTDSKEEVDMYYTKQNPPQPQIRKIHAYIPPYCGCKFCKKAEIKGMFYFCPEKNKHYTMADGGIKRCPVFRSKNEIIT